jgi:feruloyl esterase
MKIPFSWVALSFGAIPAAGAAQPCESLSKFTSVEHQIVIRQVTQESTYCRVEGSIDARTGRDGKAYGLGFALALPTDWNGRFLFQGGGGLNGSVQPPLGAQFAGDRPALTRGFAVASTDSGHQGAVFDASFLQDQQAALDFLSRGVATVAVIAKQLVAQRYGKAPEHSYFVGCSTGGREAMLMSQRYPGYFDGIVAAAPAMRTSFSNLGLRHATTALNVMGAPFSDAQRKLIVDALLGACDALDGSRDGFIFAPQECRFDPGVLACQGGQQDSCLSDAQVNAIRTVMRGPRTASGRQVYPGYFYDTGIANKQGLPGILAGPMIPEGKPAGTRMDVDAAAAQAMTARAMLGDTNAWTNLGTFRGHGGKLIFMHGLSDPWFSAQDTLQYYERLAQDNADEPLAQWSRLFLVPGMGHCAGGARTLDRVDLLDAIVAWVEQGRAPERVIATGASAPGESRPLCPWPAHAQYSGKGDAHHASNYICQPGNP